MPITGLPKMNRKMLLALGAYAAIAMAGILCLHLILKKLTLNAIDIQLRTAAAAASALLGDEVLDKAVIPGSISSSEDMGSILQLSKLCKNSGVKYAYIVFKPSSSFRFAACSATLDELEHGGFTRYYEEYSKPPKELLEAYETGKAKFANCEDSTGKYRAAFVPVDTKAGLRFIACSDMGSEEVDARLAPASRGAALLAALAILMAIPLIWMHFSIEGGTKMLLHEKQAQLIHAGRLTAMGEMAAGIAHEINQPLCVIRGYLELLQSVLINEPVLKARQLDGAFDIGIKSVDKASKIINHMRSFVRLKNGEPKPINLRTPIEEGLSFFNEQVKLHNIHLDMKFEDGLPDVKIDPQKFEQVVVNLVSNARYAVDEKGAAKGREFKKRIELRLKHDKAASKVLFEVYDNGTGMSQDIIGKCGEPFFTTKKPGEGTGLGVSIVKEIIQDFEGTLHIESVKGEGSLFRVAFPAASPSVQRPTDPSQV